MKKRLLILALVVSTAIIGTIATASADDGGTNRSIGFCTTINNSLVSAQAAALFGTPVAVPFTECYIPAGGTATISNVTFNACDSLTYGYQLNLGANQDVASFPGTCGPASAAGATIGPVAAPTLIRIYLRDNTCNSYTFYSDGPHAAVTGSGPWEVAISDAGGPGTGCFYSPAIPRSPFPQPNLQLTLTITGPASPPED